MNICPSCGKSELSRSAYSPDRSHHMCEECERFIKRMQFYESIKSGKPVEPSKASPNPVQSPPKGE